MITEGNMSAIKRRAVSLLKTLTILALAVPLLSSTGMAQDADGRSELGAPIEGTWIMQVHRVVDNVTFTALESLTAGGVVLATGTIDRTPPPPISPLHGTWKRIGGNRYANSLSFFIFDEAGNAVAMFQNYQTFHLNANDEIVGKGEAYICDPNGDNCVNIHSPIIFTGKRMNAQLP